MKKTMKHYIWAVVAALTTLSLTACGSDDPEMPDPDTPNSEQPSTPETPDQPEEPGETDEPDTPLLPVDLGGPARGADVSWLTQLESQGYKFYTPGSPRLEMECMELLRDYCGVNSIRLRVWVNPSAGWNNKDDVMVKARRASALGLRLMVDFHFSDTWADPGAQKTPAGWSTTDLETLKSQMTAHITDVLGAMKAEGITPEWVQIGNETANGMLYPLGQADTHPGNFAALVTNGHRAVKAIFPDAKTIVHIDQGNNVYRIDYIFGILKKYSAEYDMMGVSFYPEASNWSTEADKLEANLRMARATYERPVMICETGMHYYKAAEGEQMMQRLVDLSTGADALAEGVFYWEPEAPVDYNGGYSKGCFVNGAPTGVLNPFVKAAAN